MGSGLTDLRNRHALVCGGSRGIGRACALELAQRGAVVTLAARDETALRTACEQLNGADGSGHAYICHDFADPTGLRDVVAALIDTKGPIHILINNTGGPPAGPIATATPDALLDAFGKHVICNHRLADAVVPAMKSAGYGRIINIISTSVIVPIAGLGVSNTTRGAVANWGRTLAGELAPFGITVNNVLPGATDTDRLASLIQIKADKAGVTIDAMRTRMFETIPMGRFAEPREIAAVVGFLASPAASYVTGVNLPVDGGRLAVQ